MSANNKEVNAVSYDWHSTCQNVSNVPNESERTHTMALRHPRGADTMQIKTGNIGSLLCVGSSCTASHIDICQWNISEWVEWKRRSHTIHVTPRTYTIQKHKRARRPKQSNNKTLTYTHRTTHSVTHTHVHHICVVRAQVLHHRFVEARSLLDEMKHTRKSIRTNVDVSCEKSIISVENFVSILLFPIWFAIKIVFKKFPPETVELRWRLNSTIPHANFEWCDIFDDLIMPINHNLISINHFSSGELETSHHTHTHTNRLTELNRKLAINHSRVQNTTDKNTHPRSSVWLRTFDSIGSGTASRATQDEKI